MKVSPNKQTKTFPRRKQGFVLTATLVLIGVAALCGVGYAYRDELKEMAHTVVEYFRGSGKNSVAVSSEEVSYAKDRMYLLFSSAQDTFIHRGSGDDRRMAKSMEELGAGYRIGATGTIIYEDLWLTRYLRYEEEEIPPEDGMESFECMAMARPYRYAVVPVNGLGTAKEDSRTTCILAIPVNHNNVPVLVLLAGPIKQDPLDFRRRDWPLWEITDRELCDELRQMVEKHAPFTKDLYSKTLEVVAREQAKAEDQTTTETAVKEQGK